MSPAAMKAAIVELTRSGCRVERVVHDAAAVVFRTTRGRRLVLQSAPGGLLLAEPPDEGGSRLGTYGSLSEAMRAVAQPQPVVLGRTA